jgi:Ni,Fe-hydrogenase III large subunit/Ni,Fe-hydrogenase III component G
MEPQDITARIPARWVKSSAAVREGVDVRCEIESRARDLTDLCSWVQMMGFTFAGLIVEQQAPQWLLRYIFYPVEADAREMGVRWIHILAGQLLAHTNFPSITKVIPAADWHERESADLFGLTFEGHPQLGDFVLHDDAWHEDVAPMRQDFDARAYAGPRTPSAMWHPGRVVQADGAFAMPIGPIYSGVTESAHFLLETVGEDVIRAAPRFYYKHRAVEKIAEGRWPEDVLLLAERFNGIAAFAHGLAFAQALESIDNIEVPPRAQVLRTVLAELERLRHHTGFIHDICESTALVVAASQAAILEEDLLRLCGSLTGHRYLFGLIACGGLTRDFEDSHLTATVLRAGDIVRRLRQLEMNLIKTSSFLDRLEEVGMVTGKQASAYGLVGPLARASGVSRDLRRLQPYAGYAACTFEAPIEREGDGYARLRVLFAEAGQSLRIMEQALTRLPSGAIRLFSMPSTPGAALGCTEAPLGAAFHWVRIDESGRVSRYRIIPPSFVNWHAFHLAAETFAFQDFPIILASFGLSIGENDR